MSPVYKLTANSVKNGRTVYGSMLAGNITYTPPGDYESIATATVGAGGASYVEFSSIPQTYKHLQIRGIARTVNTGTVGNDNVEMRFNSDTGSNYVWHYIYANSSTCAAGNNTNQTVMLNGKPGNASALTNAFGGFVSDILDYADTNKYKTVRVLSGIDNNGSGQLFYNSNLWRSTSAITTIRLLYGADFAQYSHFALYGMKGV